MSNSPLLSTHANSRSLPPVSFSDFLRGCLEAVSFRIKLEIVNGVTEPLGEVIHPRVEHLGMRFCGREGRFLSWRTWGFNADLPFSVALSGDQTRERERRKVFQIIPTPSESQSFQQGPSIHDLLAVNTSLVAPAVAPDAIVSLAEDGGILFRKQFIGAELRQLQEILPLCSSLIGFHFEFHYGLQFCFLNSMFCMYSVSFHPPTPPLT